MALRALAGSGVLFVLTAQDPDTLASVPDLPVFLDLILTEGGPATQVAGGTTDSAGQARISVTLPAFPGTYRYRARTPGLAELWRPDTSREVPIEAVGL